MRLLPFFQWREADLRDLLLVLFISAGWTWLWVSIVRFLDTMKIKALGFPLLILFAIVTIGNNMFDISKTVTPIAINSFPYGGLLNLDLRDIVVIVGVVAITVSTAVSVLRPSRLSESWLLDGIATVGSEPSRYLAILGGVLWAGESYSRFVDAKCSSERKTSDSSAHLISSTRGTASTAPTSSILRQSFSYL